MTAEEFTAAVLDRDGPLMSGVLCGKAARLSDWAVRARWRAGRPVGSTSRWLLAQVRDGEHYACEAAPPPDSEAMRMMQAQEQAHVQMLTLVCGVLGDDNYPPRRQLPWSRVVTFGFRRLPERLIRRLEVHGERAGAFILSWLDRRITRQLGTGDPAAVLVSEVLGEIVRDETDHVAFLRQWIAAR